MDPGDKPRDDKRAPSLRRRRLEAQLDHGDAVGGVALFAFVGNWLQRISLVGLADELLGWLAVSRQPVAGRVADVNLLRPALGLEGAVDGARLAVGIGVLLSVVSQRAGEHTDIGLHGGRSWQRQQAERGCYGPAHGSLHLNFASEKRSAARFGC